MNSESSKYIFKTLLAIFIVSILVDRVVFSGFNKISDRVFSGQTVGKLNQYLKIKDSLEIIVYGNSRANHHINTAQINKNSFNMGVDGTSIAYSGTLIKLLSNKKKQIILLHIEPEEVFNKNYSGNDIKFLKIKYNRNSTIKEEIDKIKQNNFFQNFYYSLSYNGVFGGIIKNYFEPNYNYKTYFGYDPIYVNKNQKEIFKKIVNEKKFTDNASSQRVFEMCKNDLEINKIYSNYINELKDFCLTNNKKLMIFTSPYFFENCKIYNEKLKEILKTKKIDYYDFSDLFKENNQLKFWKDSSHLSSLGAEIFTEEIKNLLEE
jgi:hypothetical protein